MIQDITEKTVNIRIVQITVITTEFVYKLEFVDAKKGSKDLIAIIVNIQLNFRTLS